MKKFLVGRITAARVWALNAAISRADLELKVKALEADAIALLLERDISLADVIARRKRRIDKAQLLLVRVRAALLARRAALEG